jgi:DNA topoisomerase-1
MKVWQAAEDKILPTLVVGDMLGKPVEVRPEQHFTEPAARYSDATLIKALEEYGIGRPSTYAPTLTTVIDRGYVIRDDNKKLFPSDTAFIVTDLLKEHFPNIVDYDFTANMEKQFDGIAEGDHEWRKVMADFYTPFHELIVAKGADLSRADVMKERKLGVDPISGKEVIVRTGRFGPYVQVGEATDENPKPPRASLNKNQLMDTLTLSEAMKLLIFPRTLGKLENGEDLIVNKGPFGPYMKSGGVNVTLPPDIDPAEVTFDQAKMLFTEGAEKKRLLMTPLLELGEDPETKTPLLVKSGRYGAYVTDGKTNATIPKDQDPKTVTREQAIELLAKKRKSPKRAWKGKKKDAAE